jgi:hypothetical protein
VPITLTDAFSEDATKKVQWKAFLRKGGLDRKVPALPEMLLQLREFLGPVLQAAAGQELSPGDWRPGGPWKKAKP